MLHWITSKTGKLVLTPIAIGLIVGGYFYYRSTNAANTETRYITATPERGMLITSIAGTGQVSSQNQIDVKAKASGEVLAVLVKEAQEVKHGNPLITIDSRAAYKTVRDARQSVRDAEISLASARLTMSKLKQPADASALLQAQNALNQAKRDLAKLQEPPNPLDIKQAGAKVASAEQSAKISADGKTPQSIRNVYDTTVTTLRGTAQTLYESLLDVSGILGIDSPVVDLDLTKLFSAMDSSRAFQTEIEYRKLKPVVDDVRARINSLALQNEDTISIDDTISKTQAALDQMTVLLNTTVIALHATPISSSFAQNDLDSLVSTIQSDQTNTTSKTSSLLSQVQAITNAKNVFSSAELTLSQAQLDLEKLKQGADQKEIDAAEEKVKEKEQTLAVLQAGATQYDIALAQNTIDQRLSSLTAARAKLTDATQTLEDYTVRSPFDGIVAKISVQKSDEVGSTAVATIITRQKIAVIALNEVDASKIQVGQKATLTFDAIDNLTITGDVIEVSPLGIVAQGVVNYDIKIAFDTQDQRVKAGMSVRASIITSSKQDVLLIPNAAVKSQGGQSYVELLTTTSTKDAAQGGVTSSVPPQQQPIETGDANDTVTEIKSGLSGDEVVIIQTILPTSAKATTQTNSSIRIPGLTGGSGGGGGNFRTGGTGFGR